MASNSSPEGRQNSGDNVFGSIPVGENEACLLAEFLAAHDLADNSRTSDHQRLAEIRRLVLGIQSRAVRHRSCNNQGYRRFQEPLAAGTGSGRRHRQSSVGVDSPILRLAG